MDLLSKIAWTYAAYDRLPDKKYILAFSGGKDSHVLLSTYISWVKTRGRTLNLSVVFADTYLEADKLYTLVNSVSEVCQQCNIPFNVAKRPLNKSFWVIQYGLGYPVPNHRNRWCTKVLKVEPMSKYKGTPITGSHYGESTKRDNRISKCGSNECGVDKLNNTIEPLAIWSNCDIWDYIMLYADDYLYNGCADSISALYEISDSSNGSLRMGCMLCPVVSQTSIEKNISRGITPAFIMGVRLLLEELRTMPRINAPNRFKKNGEPILGALTVQARKDNWSKMQQYLKPLLKANWITEEEIDTVDRMLDNNTYPPTYPKTWIQQEIERLAV